MQKYCSWVFERATLRNVIVAIMAIIPFNALIFPLMSSHFTNLAGGLRTLDVQLGYMPADAIRQIGEYGDAARKFYLVIEWTADLFYPAVYCALFTLLLGVMLKKAVAPRHPYRNLVVAPIMMMVCDYLENNSISLMLLSASLRIPVIAWFAAIASLLKWLFGGFVILSILIALVALLIQLVRANPQEKE